LKTSFGDAARLSVVLGSCSRKKGKGVAKATKNKGGRPTKYKPEFAKVAAQMCKLGVTDADLAAAFDVTTVTVWNWQARHPEFF